MSPIERKWWFALPVMFIAMAATLWLLDYAQPVQRAAAAQPLFSCLGIAAVAGAGSGG
eukprot:gene18304-21902_t